MAQLQHRDQYDPEKVQEQVQEASTGSDDGQKQPGLNPFALQVAAQLREGSLTPTMIIGQYRLFEGVLLFVVGILFFSGEYHLLFSSGALKLTAAAGLAALTILFIQIADGYQIQSLRSRFRFLPRTVACWGITIALLAAALTFFSKFSEADAKNLLTLFFIGACILVVERIAFGIAVRHWARNGVMERRAVIVGGGNGAKEFIRLLELQPDNDIRICGIFDDRGDQRSPLMVAGYPKLGTVAELVEFGRRTRIDMLIISLPMSAEDRILQLLNKLWVLPVDIRLAAHANKLRFRPRAYSHVGAVPMLDIFNRPISDWDSVAKRIFDITFSLCALCLLWPIMIATAIAIKATSPGPVFFRQNRHGFNNEVIKVLKFRSMYTHMSDPTARNAVTKNDPRVTRVGRFIRKTSIDELPQFFNVLRGSLSLVGPRPHAVAAQTADRSYNEIVDGYFARHRVKPGVTGWAQINGWRGEIDSDEKIKMRTAFDLYYIENWSLFFDLKILFLTPFRLLNTENAY